MTYAETHGQELESDYPYTARTGSCKASSTKGKVDVKKIASVQARSVDQLKAAIAAGPTSVTVEADRTVFQHYTSGVMDSTSCGTSLDHGVLLVGYGTEKDTPYWLVKNSWGAAWGEKGYFRVKRDMKEGDAGLCGITLSASYPEF